jgi:hypothetical protein
VCSSSTISRAPVGPCGWPYTRLQPYVFIRPSGNPVCSLNHRSLTANGLWVVTASRSPKPSPAASRAALAAGTGALGISALPTLAVPVPRMRATPSPPASSRARAPVVTTMPALPSAGWVWVP